MTEAALRRAAATLGRSADQLQLLDRRPLPFAFVTGHYEALTLRDRASGELLEVALDLDSGERVDPVNLRRLDRERASIEGAALTPELVDLMLRHPELRAVRVHVRRTDGSTHQAALSVPEIVALAARERDSAIELAGDPEVPD
jgi:hypothetical protein